MANSLYDRARDQFLRGGYDWDNLPLRLFLLNSNYTVDLVNHNTIADVVPVASMVSYSDIIPSMPLANTSGWAEMEAYEFVQVLPGFSTVEENTVRHIVVAEDIPGSIDACRLVAYIDTAVGLPFLADGNGYTFTPDVSLGGGVQALFRI